MQTTSDTGRRQPWFSPGPDRLVLLAIVGLTILRSWALFVTPLGLGVDEAQYWLWSQSPDFGYFTKPPLIAWIIGISHGIFGHSEMAVRLPACWLHLATSLVLWRASTWLYGAGAGRLTGLIWASLPAVGLGSFLISTDTPLLLCVSLALLAIAGVISEKITPARGMFFAGLALGFGMLAKYAAVYTLFGMMLIWAAGRHQAQPLLPGKHLLIAIAGCLLAVSPNLFWNLAHDFSTLRHLGDNANIGQQNHSLMKSIQFLSSQAAVAGPLVAMLMLGIFHAAFMALRYAHDDPAQRRARPPHMLPDKHASWLIWMALPALGLMTVQAYVSEANANWAMATYPPLTIWLGGWLDGHPNAAWQKLRLWLAASAIGVNLLISGGLLLATAAGSLGPLTPKSDPLRRLRGWEHLARDLEPHLNAQMTSQETARIIADRRATAALLSWHFYGLPVEIMVHDLDGLPSNHFEANLSWQRQVGKQVLALSQSRTPPAISGIIWQGDPYLSQTRISHNRMRDLYIHAGQE